MMEKIYKKIRNKSRTVWSLFLIKISLIINAPLLTALILVLFSRTLNRGQKRIVLCLRRSVFINDVQAMSKYSGKIQYVIIERKYFQFILNHFTPKADLGKISERNYHVSDIGKMGKVKYHAYLKRLIPCLQRSLSFEAVLCANMGYIEQQEIAKVCKEENIPLIVLFKEGMAVAFDHEDWARRGHANLHFVGTKMLVYSQKIADALISCNIPGVTPNTVRVVGMPRFDVYFREKLHALETKQITFFSTYIHDRLPYMLKDHSRIEEVCTRFDEFHKTVMDFALHNPTYQVVIKTKTSKHFIAYVNDVYSKNFKERIPNLRITNEGEISDLIQKSIAVIGCGTTVLLEAFIANRIAISFDFRDMPIETLDYFRGSHDLIQYVKSESELLQSIEHPNATNTNMEQRVSFMQRFIFSPDGKASNRAEEEIIKTIDEFKKR